ncbi:hypothetical protein GALMADRAFT_247602 [Galerina marginata CBS 339.88]|uniref:Uncharacterized protein n=1 Tax=Galerina marginata (strain CBS 339.88) TaxID=685588 RepID=A0A067T8P7_GALM3|nr:hypothetical protein GALMADRAFT_247602 [Galerina marginata CBS 339.88]
MPPTSWLEAMVALTVPYTAPPRAAPIQVACIYHGVGLLLSLAAVEYQSNPSGDSSRMIKLDCLVSMDSDCLCIS